MKNYNVTECGVIVTEPEFSHEYGDQSFYLFDLAVTRLSGTVDTIPVMVKAGLPGFAGLSKGDRICVKGYINTRRREDGVVPKTQTYINCYKLEPAADKDTNFVTLFGYVCGNKGLRETPKGRKITELTIAVPRYKRVSDYVHVICWEDNAETAKDLALGTKIIVRGRMQSRTYRENLTAYEVSVGRLTVLPEKKDAEKEKEEE